MILLLSELGFPLLYLFASPDRLDFSGEPVDRPPQGGTQERQHDEVDAVRGEQEQEEQDLQRGERGVGRHEEGRGRAGSEDAGPQVLHKRGRHAAASKQRQSMNLET